MEYKMQQDSENRVSEHIIRKQIKKSAKKVLKTHYLILVITLLFAGILGARFTDAFDVFKISTGTEGGTGVLNLTSFVSAVSEDAVDNFIARSEKEEEKEKESGFKIGPIGVELSKGTIASVITKINSGGIFVMLYSAAKSVLKSGSASGTVIVILCLLLYLAFMLLVTNIYKVIYSRVFLESRTYKKIHSSKFLYLFKVKKYLKSCGAMLRLTVYQTLWDLTIIGGIIKRYSYYLVPFIVAENPDISSKDAILMSRRMMNGRKWKMFVFDISFLPWQILNSLTFGMLGLFFLNPYKLSSEAEYYALIRSGYKASEGEGRELLNDTYLYETAPDELLAEKYADVRAWADEPEVQVEYGSKVKQSFAKWFGIVWSYNNDEDRAYRAAQIRKQQIERWKEISEKIIYPERLFTIPVKEKSESADDLGYDRNYSVSSIILMFFSFCMIGYLWEVILYVVRDGILVNRGTLLGPWLPIYGSGALMILILLRRLRSKPVIEFISAIILCGVLEYLSSYFLEITHNGKRWWDYTGTFLNINGRICAEGLLVFGLGGMAVVYLLAPALDNLFRKMNRKVMIPVIAVLLGLFIADCIYSHYHPNEGRGITDFEGISGYYDCPSSVCLRQTPSPGGGRQCEPGGGRLCKSRRSRIYIEV